MIKFRIVCIAALLLFIYQRGNAQVGRFKGGKSYQVGLGFADAGVLGNFYYGINFDQIVRGSVGGGVIVGKVADVNYKGVFFDGMGSFALYSMRNKFYINLTGGISFIGDFINKFESESFDKTFSFNYGILGGLESDFYVSRTLVFVLSANQRYYIKKEFGNGRYHLSASVRYAF